jgi:hypothetical protein
MVTFTAGAGDGLRELRNTRILYFLEGAAQTFKVGAVVVLTAGKLVKAATAPVAAIVGIAAEAASGVTDRKIGVLVADEIGEFQGRVQDTGALALAQVGAQYGLVLDSVGGKDIFRVNVSDTTNKAVVVTELIDAVGDVNGRVGFKFMNAVRTPQAS